VCGAPDLGTVAASGVVSVVTVAGAGAASGAVTLVTVAASGVVSVVTVAGAGAASGAVTLVTVTDLESRRNTSLFLAVGAVVVHWAAWVVVWRVVLALPAGALADTLFDWVLL